MAARTAIGLDIGSSCVRAAQVSFSKDGPELERLGQVALPPGVVRDGEVVDPDAVADALKTLWDRVKFKGKDVVLGVSNQKVVVRLAELPWMPLDELKDSLKFQVADLIPMDVDDTVLDFVPLEEGVNGNARVLRGLLVAASQDAVLTAIRAVQKAGLRVSTVDLTPFAVLRASAVGQSMGSGPEAVVDVGARVTNIIVHDGGVPKFVRILLLGGEDVTGAVIDKLGRSRDEAEMIKRNPTAPGAAEARQVIDTTMAQFVDEVRSSLDYFVAMSGGTPLTRLVLSGGGSLADGLAQRLATATRTPVEYGRAFHNLRMGKTGLSPEQLQFVEPLSAVPVGLAMGAF